jgi:hypothetical protein
MGAFFTPQPITIYVDMDGVLAAWTETVFEMYGLKVPDHAIPYEVQHTIGVDEDEMWDRLNSLGTEWWANLPPYPWMRDLWSRLEALGHDMAIATSPCTIGNSAKGKVEWLRRHISPDFRDYHIGSKKWRLAHPRAVLIDDSEEKLGDFTKYGGIGVLFPQPWNKGGRVKPECIVDQVVSNVRAALLRANLTV